MPLADYAHWNEDAEYMWWHEEGKHVEEPEYNPDDYLSDYEEEDDVTYMIVRFVFKGENEVIKTGLTLEEAQEHCNREDTHGDGWFDGYTEE